MYIGLFGLKLDRIRLQVSIRKLPSKFTFSVDLLWCLKYSEIQRERESSKIGEVKLARSTAFFILQEIDFTKLAAVRQLNSINFN